MNNENGWVVDALNVIASLLISVCMELDKQDRERFLTETLQDAKVISEKLGRGNVWEWFKVVWE